MQLKTLIPALALAGALLAQPQRPPMATQYWWENKLAVNSLNLSEAQTKQLNTIQASNVSRLMDLPTVSLLASKANSAGDSSTVRTASPVP